MTDFQCLDTDLNLRRDFIGKQTRISANRSSLFAMTAIAGNMVFSITHYIMCNNPAH